MAKRKPKKQEDPQVAEPIQAEEAKANPSRRFIAMINFRHMGVLHKKGDFVPESSYAFASKGYVKEVKS